MSVTTVAPYVGQLWKHKFYEIEMKVIEVLSGGYLRMESTDGRTRMKLHSAQLEEHYVPCS